MNKVVKDCVDFIEERSDEIAEESVKHQYELQPEIWEKYGEAGYRRSIKDVKYHLSYINEAISNSNQSLLMDYIAWLKVLFTELKFPDEGLPMTFKCIRDTLNKFLPDEYKSISLPYLDSGIQQISKLPSSIPSFIEDEMPLSDLAKKYLDALLKGDRNDASQMIIKAVENGTSIKNIYMYVFQRSQHEIGRLWQTNKITVAQEHYCTAATQLIMSQLYPYIFSTDKNGLKFVGACVGEELHEIGIRMVADFFEMEGWDTYYLGANTPIQSILQTTRDQEADILGLSVTITFHMNMLNNIIEAVRASDIGSNVKIMVGGYPFNAASDLWKQVGADGYARDAQEAIATASALVSEQN
ncbi:cobalamin-binding protein [Candidatus Poribacteria bacterium]|nr:cobalamin-binding protein [Candidatus Poribacteria bacterium]